MEYEFVEDGEIARRKRPWLEVTLVSGFIVCILFGIVALVALYLLSTRDAPVSAANPLQTLRTDRIATQRALMQLAGDPVEGLAYQAINAGELDTAYAMLLYTTDFRPQSRLALYLQLARRYLANEQPAQAVQVYRLARSMAILDTGLSTVERSQGLVQIAAGLLDAGEPEMALDAARQAKLLAQRLPELLPAQRTQIVESVRPLALDLDDSTLTQELEELSRNPYLSPTGEALTSRWATLGSTVEPAPAVVNAVIARQQAARLLAERMALTGGADIERERQALAATLVAEDQARGNYFQQVLSSGITLPQQFQLLQERRAWLALKARIVAGGFGMPVVPEWEATFDSILNDLSIVTANLGSVLDALINAQATPLDQAMLRAEALRWLALQAELGLHPGASVTDLGERLRFAQVELERQGHPLALPLVYEAKVSPPGFRIQPLQ